MALVIAVALIIVGGGAVAVGGVLSTEGVTIGGPPRESLLRRTKRMSDATRRLVEAGVGALIGLAVGLVMWILLGYSLVLGLAGCVLMGVVGALVPQARAERRERERLRSGDHGVADFAGLLSVELRSGLGLDASLENVATELSGVLADEMQTANTQVRFGMPRDRSLELLRERLPAHNVERLVQVLQHAGELGAPVADTLDKLAQDCATRRFQEVREEAAKLPVKILFPVLFCIFPPMLVVLAGPAMVDIIEALG